MDMNRRISGDRRSVATRSTRADTDAQQDGAEREQRELRFPFGSSDQPFLESHATILSQCRPTRKRKGTMGVGSVVPESLGPCIVPRDAPSAVVLPVLF
jgi:hypothetical protein